jgi:hypothetical protein
MCDEKPCGDAFRKIVFVFFCAWVVAPLCVRVGDMERIDGWLEGEV